MAKTKTAEEQKKEPQITQSPKQVTEKEKSIFIRTVAKRYPYEVNQHLYTIGPPPPSDEKRFRPFSTIPSILTSDSACVEWDSSIIYFFNGSYNPEVFYLDTRNPIEGWKRGPPMIVPKAKPYAMVVGGKIYVVGSAENDQQQWGEVLDPLMNEWTVLVSHPALVSSNIASHAVLQEGKKLVVHPDSYESPLYLYDTDNKSWEIIDSKFDNSGDTMPRGCSPCVVLDDFLYYYCGEKVHAYDLVTRIWVAEPVRGLDRYSEVLLPLRLISYCGSPPENVFMVHLGNGLLCLIWTNSRWKYVRCTKFRVVKHGDDRGEDVILHALIEAFSEYNFDNKDGDIIGCLAL